MLLILYNQIYNSCILHVFQYLTVTKLAEMTSPTMQWKKFDNNLSNHDLSK